MIFITKTTYFLFYLFKYFKIHNYIEPEGIMAPRTTYSLLRGQKPASVQRLGTGSGNQRFGQGHQLEINSVSLFFDGGGNRSTSENPCTRSESGQTPHRNALN